MQDLHLSGDWRFLLQPGLQHHDRASFQRLEKWSCHCSFSRYMFILRFFNCQIISLSWIEFAAIDLLKNAEVMAIIGLQKSFQAEFFVCTGFVMFGLLSIAQMKHSGIHIRSKLGWCSGTHSQPLFLQLRAVSLELSMHIVLNWCPYFLIYEASWDDALNLNRFGFIIRSEIHILALIMLPRTFCYSTHYEFTIHILYAISDLYYTSHVNETKKSIY